MKATQTIPNGKAPGTFEMKKPADITHININHMGELLWWSSHLGTSPEKLLSITSKVGNSLEEVKKHLH